MTRKMKDSGIEWIGEIPKHWSVYSPYRILKVTRGNTGFKKDDMESEGEYVAVQYGQTYQMKELTEEYDKYIDSKFYKEDQKVISGDTILVSTSETLEDLGHSCYYNRKDIGLLGGEQILLRVTDDKLDKRFLYYASTYFQNDLKQYATGVKVFRFNVGDLKKIKMVLPPIEEQRKISKKIDKELNVIDKMIKDTKDSIYNLINYKKSLITEAVTKGLNPHVEMKDSGIEWIGKIPRHWEIRRINNYFVQVKEKNEQLKEKNLLSLSYGNIVRRNIDSPEGLLPANFKNYHIVEPGDIVLRMTDLQNDQISLRTGYVEEKGIITSAYITIRNQFNDEVLSKYIQLYLHSFDIYKGFYGMGSGVRQNVNFNHIKKLEIVLPPFDEQKEIVQYLREQINKIDELIDDKSKLIIELESYKKSLIYEYVTGKKEV